MHNLFFQPPIYAFSLYTHDSLSIRTKSNHLYGGIFLLGFIRFLVLNLPLCHLSTKHPSNRLEGLEVLSSLLFWGSQFFEVDSVFLVQNSNNLRVLDIKFGNFPFGGILCGQVSGFYCIIENRKHMDWAKSLFPSRVQVRGLGTKAKQMPL